MWCPHARLTAIDSNARWLQGWQRTHLPLAVVEVGWHGDDGALDGVTEVRLRCLLHLREDEAADLAGRVLLPARLRKWECL